MDTRTFGLLCVTGLLGLFVSNRAAAQVTVISPEMFTVKCSELVQGDNEFWGSGPETFAIASLFTGNDTNIVYFRVEMIQQETGGDRSTGYADLSRVFVWAPSGKTFTHISMPNAQGNWQWFPIAPNQVLVQTPIYYVDTNTSNDVFANPAWWLQHITVEGDQNGPDLFANCVTAPAPRSGIMAKSQKVNFLAQ